jgi:transposase
LTNEELQQQNQELKDQIAILTQQLDWLKRQLFGRKGEQLNHPDLFTVQQSEKPDSSGDAAAPEEQAPSTAGAKTEKRTRPIRKERLPENLPVRTEEIIPEIVQANPEAWRNCGFE